MDHHAAYDDDDAHEDDDAHDGVADDDTDDDDTDDDVTMNNERRVAGRAELWLAAAGLFLTIIGATWWLESNLATKADIAAIRQELQQDRERSDDQMQELRGYIVGHLDGHAGD